MRKILFFVPLLFILISAELSFAGDVKFEISLDRESIAIGESAQIGLSFSGTQSMPAPDIGNVSGLDVKYVGPSTMMTVINGHVSSSVTHMYMVTPLKTGRFQLGPYNFKFKGDDYSSNMVFLDVVEERRRAAQATGAVTMGQPQEEKLDIDDRVFVTLTTERNSAFVNELIPVIVKLYVSRMNVTDIQLPVFEQESFSKVDFKEPKQYREDFNGQIFEVLEFKTNIFGTKPGDYRLGPARIKCNILVRKRQAAGSRFGGNLGAEDEFFDDFFTKIERHPVELKSDESHIIVSPLPSEGMPKYFDGAVGDYQFIYRASPTKVKAGDPVTITMMINGSGNLNTVLMPRIENLNGFKVYEPQVKTEEHSKTFTQVVIPESETITQIPGAVFVYFDPGAKTYKTISQNPIPVQVEKPKEEAPSRIVESPIRPERIDEMPREEPARDIIFIKDRPGRWIVTARSEIGAKVFMIFFTIPLIAVMLLYGFERRRNRLRTDGVYASKVLSYRSARRSMRELNAKLSARDHQAFYESLSAALRGYFGIKLRMPSAGITFEAVNRILSERGIEHIVTQKIRNLFSVCDDAKFAFAKFDHYKMKDDMKEFEEIVNYLERKKL